LVYSSDV
jgi:hypothetical protein